MATAPHWLAPALEPDPPADLPAHADVVVVGGGLMGVTIAYWLARAGTHALVLEAGALGSGASGRNAGLLLPGASPFESRSLLCRILAEEQIDAEYQVTGHLALASSESVWRRIQDEVAARPPGAPPLHALSLLECQSLLNRQISNRFLGGRYHPGGALLHPVRLVMGLARAATRRGARVFTRMPVHRVVTSAPGPILHVHTARGCVTAECVVYACGAGLSELVPVLAPALRFTRGQMLATEPLTPVVSLGMAVDRGAAYWRQTRDGAIVLGGCRDQDPAAEETRRHGINPRIQAALERLLPDVFPDLPPVRVARRWSGIMDDTADGRPLVGALSSSRAEWVLAGFGGHGLPGSIGFGKALCDSILSGAPSQGLEPYAPARFGA